MALSNTVLRRLVSPSLCSMKVRLPVVEAVLSVARTTVFGQRKTFKQPSSKGTSKAFPSVSAMLFYTWSLCTSYVLDWTCLHVIYDMIYKLYTYSSLFQTVPLSGKFTYLNLGADQPHGTMYRISKYTNAVNSRAKGSCKPCRDNSI